MGGGGVDENRLYIVIIPSLKIPNKDIQFKNEYGSVPSITHLDYST